MADRSKLATECMTVSVVRVARAPRPAQGVTFCALEGPLLVLIEADSEDEAFAICDEQGLEFISLCDD
jgi:nitrous oxidase accessory protein NosD